MKHFKLVALFLSIALFTQLKAEVINQHFSPTFGPSWSSTEQGTTDGWTYLMLQRLTDAQYIYSGDASVSLQTYNWDSDPEAYLVTPAKTGGVGWITFWYKTHSASSWSTGIMTLEIQTSSDGVAFSTVGTVTTLIEEAVWKNYSEVINDVNAKYVRLLLKKGSATAQVDIDELGITDAVAAGTPPTINAAITANIESEVGIPATIADAITLSGANVTGNVTLSFVTGTAFSVTPTTVAGSEVNAGKGLTVAFTPAVKNATTDYLKITGDNLPELFVKVEGLGLLRDIVEDFNTPQASYAYGNFDYYGWTLSGNANYADTQWGSNVDVYEGHGAVNFCGLISPKKAGGIGEISFMYRANYATPDFEVFISSDKINWTKVGNTISTSSAWTLFKTTINNAGAAYVKLATTSTDKIDVDLFIITENGATIPSAIGSTASASGVTAPISFTVPVTFTGITGNVTLSIDEPQLVLGKTTLTQAEATGIYNIPVTFNPAEGKAFAKGTITITGGGLLFPVTITVVAYLEVDQLSIDFESDWATTSMNQYVEGWNVTNGSKDNYNGALGSNASAYIQPNSSIISPPKSGGVGTVQFYAKVGWGTSTLSLSYSVDGTTWTTKEASIPISASYQKYEYVINDAAAKYVKITVGTEGYPYVDNITVTKYGVGIAAFTLLNTPAFMTQSGQTQTVKLQLQGVNISSDMQVALKTGTAFTLANTTISQNDINGKTYELEVKFFAESGTYFADELYLSGGGLLFTETIPLKGYILQDLIYQDFNTPIDEWVHVDPSDYYILNIEGWEAYGNSVTGNNAYEGNSLSLQPSAWNDPGDAYVRSVPKSGGVGEISFQYKNSSQYDPVTFRVQTYKELGGTPTVIGEDIELPPSTATTSYQKFDVIVNDADAKYVEIYCPKPGGSSGYPYIDNFAVTAKGKRVPDVTAPSTIRMAAYPGETATYAFDLAAVGVDQEIRLSLKDGSHISLDKTTILPVNSQATETITLTYDASNITFSADTLLVEGKGLLKSLAIPVLATTYQDVLVQDFNNENWYSEYDITDIWDGWLITDGRNTIESWGETPLEGTKSLRLSASDAIASSIISPAKSGGINKVEFYWRLQSSNGGEMTIDIQTSIDGETWQTVDQLKTGTISEYTGYHLYEKVVGDKEAQYLRLQALPGTYYRTSYLLVDSIAMDAMPYLRAIDSSKEVETTLSSYPLEVKVAGLLNTAAEMKLGKGKYFTLSKTAITPEAVANKAVVSFNVIFTAPEASGLWVDTIYIANNDIETLSIPVSVDYTKPYIELAGEVDSQTTTSGTATFTVQVKGILNTDATIALIGGSEFTLAQTSITPADLVDDATVSFDVAFEAERLGIFTAVLYITNRDIEPVFITLSVESKGTGIATISGSDVSVYATESGLLNIVGAPVGSKVTVFDIQGKMVFSSTTKSDKEQYSVLNKGVYVVRVNDKTWKVVR